MLQNRKFWILDLNFFYIKGSWRTQVDGLPWVGVLPKDVAVKALTPIFLYIFMGGGTWAVKYLKFFFLDVGVDAR